MSFQIGKKSKRERERKMVLPKDSAPVSKPTEKVFEEKFFEKGGKKRSATIRVVVDFSVPVTENYLKARIESDEDKNLHGSNCRCSEHRNLAKLYPISTLHSWVSEKGVTLLSWLSDHCDMGHFIPTQREINGGLSNYELHKKTVREESRAAAARNYTQ